MAGMRRRRRLLTTETPAMKLPIAILRCLALGAIALAAFPAVAAEYAPYLGHVSAQFAVSHLDISYVHGRFDKINVTIDFDPAAKTGRVLVVVDPDSIDTGNRSIDNVLRTDQFLDTAAFTEIRFASERFVFEGDKLVAVDGRLWLHGVDRPLRLEAERFVCKDVTLGLAKKPVCGGAFHASLKRTDFGMTRFIPDVGDEVRLDIGVEASPR